MLYLRYYAMAHEQICLISEAHDQCSVIFSVRFAVNVGYSVMPSYAVRFAANGKYSVRLDANVVYSVYQRDSMPALYNICIIFFSRLTDNLPCATKFQLLDSGEIQYEHGYKLGFVKDDKVSQKNVKRSITMATSNLIQILLDHLGWVRDRIYIIFLHSHILIFRY